MTFSGSYIFFISNFWAGHSKYIIARKLAWLGLNNSKAKSGLLPSKYSPLPFHRAPFSLTHSNPWKSRPPTEAHHRGWQPQSLTNSLLSNLAKFRILFPNTIVPFWPIQSNHRLFLRKCGNKPFSPPSTQSSFSLHLFYFEKFQPLKKRLVEQFEQCNILMYC